jgi:hypothetical protein
VSGAEAWLRAMVRGWVRFWFEMADTRALELVRIGVGLTLLVSYASLVSDVEAFYTEDGWMPLAHTPALTEESTSLSLLFVFRSNTAMWALWGVTIAAAGAYALGWRTNAMKLILLVGHYSFTRRAPGVAYGVDDLCSNLLFIQCFVPMGHALALDARRRASLLRAPWRQTLRSMGLRLTQVQMAIIMAFAGLEKLQGDDWWDGLGVWFAMTDWEFNFFPLGPFAAHPYLLNVLGYGAVLFELAYPALIWDRRSRGPILILAIGLHIGVAVVMGLWLFSAAMLVSHMAFAPAAWLRWFKMPADACAAPQNGAFGRSPLGSSSSSAATEGQRLPGSTDSPRASAR